MSSSNHPPPDPSAGGHFDLLRRATQKMMYKYVSFSLSLIPFEPLSIHQTVTSCERVSRVANTPFPPYVLSQPDGSSLPFLCFIFTTRLPGRTAHTHTQFAFPLGPLPRIHCTSARSSSRTSFSAHVKVSHPTSVSWCKLLAALTGSCRTSFLLC